MKHSQVLEDLIEKTNYCLLVAEQHAQLSDEQLTKSKDESSWNTLQCLEHLNRYGNFYLPEFERKLKAATLQKKDLDFKPGFWGKKFYQMLLPKDGKQVTMKTFKSKNPLKNEVSRAVLDEFIEQQHQFLNILESAKRINLNQNRCALTVPILKLNFGAALRFVIFHNVRHIEQAQRAIV